MSTIYRLGAGRLRVLTDPDSLTDSPTIVLEHPVTEHRVTLQSVPDGHRASLVAIVADAGTDIPAAPHVAGPAATGFTLGTGRVRTNRPAPRLGPADRLGLAPESGQAPWRLRVLDHLDGHRVRLEAHRPGCRCSRSMVFLGQEARTGAEAA